MELLGRRIRQPREHAHVIQEELATATGIGRVTLVRIESGEQSPRYEILVALARGFGLWRGLNVDGAVGSVVEFRSTSTLYLATP